MQQHERPATSNPRIFLPAHLHPYNNLTGRELLSSFESFKQRAEAMMSDVYALYLARSDPRIPWYAKAIIVLTVLYALSPIDIIPDFIPFLGYLDDLIIISLGLTLAIHFIPKDVWDDYREQAKAGFAAIRLNSWEGVLLILFIVMGLWKILAIGLITFMIGFILMMIFYLYTPAGLLNWGTLIFATGIVLLLIAFVKFRRNLGNWQKKVQSSQEKEPGKQ